MAKQNLVIAAKERVIFLEGEITSRLTTQFESALKRFAADGKDSVRCYVCSEGGDLASTLRMMQLVTWAPFPVDFVAYEYVASGAFLLMQCGRAAYATGRVRFTFHRTHADYQTHEETDHGRSVDWASTSEDMWSFIVFDAIMLPWFLRRGDPRSILPLFQIEATISAPQAKKVGLIAGYLSPAQVRADKAAIRKAARIRNGSRK